jgi:predicted amidophosphoribosyltransferase
LCLVCFKQCNNFDSICYVCKNPSKDFEIHSDCQQGLYYKKVIILTHYKNKVIKKLITDAKFYKRKDIFEDF